MKKIILCFSLSVLSITAQGPDESSYLSQLQQEHVRVKTEATQKHSQCAAHKAALLSRDQAKEYVSARTVFFKSCGNNSESVACRQATQKLKKGLALLQKTESYRDHYLPALEDYYISAQKFYTLPLMISLVQQPEQLNAPIDSEKDRILYVIDGMKVEGDSGPSEIWLELSHDRGALNKQAQEELKRFLESISH